MGVVLHLDTLKTMGQAACSLHACLGLPSLADQSLMYCLAAADKPLGHAQPHL